MKKIALVLSGGGFKGAFQVGALEYLRQNWTTINPESDGIMKFDVVAGVSVGSLNGALLACNEFEALQKLWRDVGVNVEEIYTSDFINTKNQTDKVQVRIDLKSLVKKFIPSLDLRISLWKGLGLLLSKSKRQKFIDDVLADAQRDFAAHFKHFRALADNSPLRKKLELLVSIDKVQNVVFKCGFVSLNTGLYYSFKHTDFKTDADFREGILASTAMPIVWEPVAKVNTIVNGKDLAVDQNVDGGIRNVSPLSDVIDEINLDDPGNDYTIVIINCASGVVEYEPYEEANIAGIALRALNDIAITEIFNNDIAEFLRINDILDQVKTSDPALHIRNYNLAEGRTKKILRPFKAIIIQPDPGVLGDALVSNTPLNEKRMNHGKQKAAEAVGVLQRNRGIDLVSV
jgi:NTE family protein